MTANQGSTPRRNLPDVALTGDNIEVIYNGNGTVGDFGGTSCAAPLWAGFTALVNQPSRVEWSYERRFFESGDLCHCPRDELCGRFS